jgi:hypothetical protein
MGKASAIRLVVDMGEFLMKPHVDSFVRTMREGDVVILIQWCYNRKGKYVLIQEIRRGGRRGSIIVLEGKNSNGWRGFGSELKHFLGMGIQLLDKLKPQEFVVASGGGHRSFCSNSGLRWCWEFRQDEGKRQGENFGGNPEIWGAF